MTTVLGPILQTGKLRLGELTQSAQGEQQSHELALTPRMSGTVYSTLMTWYWNRLPLLALCGAGARRTHLSPRTHLQQHLAALRTTALFEESCIADAASSLGPTAFFIILNSHALIPYTGKKLFPGKTPTTKDKMDCFENQRD